MVKGNQPELKEQIEKVFKITEPTSCDKVTDIGHGRTEIRTCEVVENLTFLDGTKEWKNLKTILKSRPNVSIKRLSIHQKILGITSVHLLQTLPKSINLYEDEVIRRLKTIFIGT